MSGRIFQGVLVQMKEATPRTIGVTDQAGNVVASSELELIGTTLPGFSPASFGNEKMVALEGRMYRQIGGAEGRFDYAVFVEGTDAEARSLCVMACLALSEAKSYYDEKYDKSALVKNIITESILPGDLYVHARELQFVTYCTRAVFLVRQMERPDVAVLDILRKMFPERQKDFVISVSETDIAVVREIAATADAKELIKIAQSMEQAILNEQGIRTVIGIGSPAKHLRELADRYKEAQIAIDVGKVFEPDKTIIHYENLGIGRLIYQLPTTLCEMFLSEVFKKNPIDALDQETLDIITKFFENNLNISETSRKLFVHRNTLVYRLGKIKKMTGLDLREFDQAIVFKVALMVKKYLNSQKP
jgi:carbohydrate diacid regulator